MDTWQQEIPTEGTVDLPPDPRALDALGRNHSLDTALTDLVDNSIDAGATDVLIRFIREDAALIALYVVDDGHGIGPDRIDAAMTVGGRRSYTGTDLGHFGLGLKAASFSQASSLTVLSRANRRTAVGRRWILQSDRTDFRCDKVPGAFAAEQLDRGWPLPTRPSGTVVRWDRVRSFPAFTDGHDTEEYLTRTIARLQRHLGLMFHRILQNRDLTITIDVEDTEHGTGVPVTVAPVDPFGYEAPPPGWPRTLTADTGRGPLQLHCHIWPGRSNLPGYRLPDGAERRQGLYFYRRDRLLHAGGGWEGIQAPDRTLQLARVAVDIDDHLGDLFVINPEKSRVSPGPHLAGVIGAARADDGTTMASYLQTAQGVWTRSNQRVTARRSAVLPPGKGLHPWVIRAIRDELPQLNDEPLSIVWATLPPGQFFDLDHDLHVLRLNRIYRQALLGGRRSGLNDVPVIKALLFLLMENVFHGTFHGARERDNLDLWQEVLTAAADAEKTTFEARQ